MNLNWLIPPARAAQAIVRRLRDPLSYPFMLYLWVLICGAAGGAVNFYQKTKRREARAFNIVELIGELASSSFVGVLTFWLCEYYAVNRLLEAVLIAISGHMGTRALFLIERKIAVIVEAKTGVEMREQRKRGD